MSDYSEENFLNFLKTERRMSKPTANLVINFIRKTLEKAPSSILLEDKDADDIISEIHGKEFILGYNQKSRGYIRRAVKEFKMFMEKDES